MTLSSTNQWPTTARQGPDARAVLRLKIGGFASVAICMMAVAVALFGLLPVYEVGVVTAYCAVGNLIFYGVLRSGRAARFRDPSCVFAHHLFIISILLLGCLLIPQDRGASLQILLLIWAFDVPLLSSRQLTAAALIAIVGVFAIVLANAPTNGGGQALQSNLLALSMTLVYLPVLVAISRAVRIIRARQVSQRAALAEALAQLRTLSELDALTGASNRRHALDVLTREAARQNRTRHPFSIGLLDLDFFKRVNDSHGHAVGDAVLIGTARRLREALPEHFTVARWGGEEFLIVMPDTSSAAATEWMRQSRRRLVSHDWTDCAPGLSVDASVGVCEHRGNGPIEVTLDRADQALYRAKAEGRGRVVEQSD